MRMGSQAHVSYIVLDGNPRYILGGYVYLQSEALATNLDQCPSSNHECRKLRAVRLVLIPVQIRKNISISHDLQCIRGFSRTLINIIPISKLAVALLTWSTMYSYRTGPPVPNISYYRVNAVSPFKVTCSYLVNKKFNKIYKEVITVVNITSR